jgi:hypothetical protein
MEKARKKLRHSPLPLTAHADESSGFLPHSSQFGGENIQSLVPAYGSQGGDIAPLARLLKGCLYTTGTIQILESGSAERADTPLIYWMAGITINPYGILFFDESNPDTATAGTKLTDRIHQCGATSFRRRPPEPILAPYSGVVCHFPW